MNQINKEIKNLIGIDLKRVSGPTLHKYHRDIYYISMYMQGHIPSQEGKNADIVEW